VNLRAEIITAYTDHEPPMNFTQGRNQFNAKEDEVKGFAPDVVRELMRRTGDKGTISIIPWVRSYDLLKTQPNVMLFSMARTPMREASFQWVGPLAYSKSLIYVKRGSAITIGSLDDARKLEKIGVLLEDSKEQYLKALGFTNLDSESNNWPGTFRKLISGKISALAMTDLDLPNIARNEGLNPSDFQPVYELFLTRLYIGISKSTDPALVRRWQLSLDAMKADGTFEKIAQKWAVYWNTPWIVKDGAVQIAQ